MSWKETDRKTHTRGERKQDGEGAEMVEEGRKTLLRCSRLRWI